MHILGNVYALRFPLYCFPNGLIRTQSLHQFISRVSANQDYIINIAEQSCQAELLIDQCWVHSSTIQVELPIIDLKPHHHPPLVIHYFHHLIHCSCPLNFCRIINQYQGHPSSLIAFDQHSSYSPGPHQKIFPSKPHPACSF